MRSDLHLHEAKKLDRGPDSRVIINRVVDPDPDPYWIRIQLGLWIRIRIRIQNPDPDPGGQK